MKLLYYLFLWLLPISVTAEAPNAFYQLGKSFDQERAVVLFLEDDPYFESYKFQFSQYRRAIEKSFDLGYRVDQIILEKGVASHLSTTYLGELRRLEKEQKKIAYIYVKAMKFAIKSGDKRLFEQLIVHPLSVLNHASLKSKVTAYYKSIRNDYPIEEGELLLYDEKLDLYSREVAAQEREAYEEHIAVINEEEAQQLKKLNRSNKKYKVLVFTEKTADGYLFYAENLHHYALTLTLDMKKMVNFNTSLSLPLHVELSAKERKKILKLTQKDLHKSASFSSSFGWVMGRASTRHDSGILYRVPFALSSKVAVSQGFDGKATHKGLSKYAVDFPCLVGTKIYAARAGKVVAAVSHHNKGGYNRSYGKYANFIVIEHKDGSLAKYYHLKQNGVSVNIDDYVERGQLIGESGNTGYTSGPHLHFSVSKVEPRKQRRPMTLPFRFRTARGVITHPKQGDWYTVVK